MTQLYKINVKLSVVLIKRRQVGGSLLTTILSLRRTLPPTISKTLVLSALAG